MVSIGQKFFCTVWAVKRRANTIVKVSVMEFERYYNKAQFINPQRACAEGYSSR